MYQPVSFIQQLDALHHRLRSLYQQVEDQQDQAADLIPPTLLEIGIATEEFQIATEELQAQNEQMVATLTKANQETRYYQTLFDQLPEACLVTNPDGKILEANQAAVRLLHLERKLLFGKLLVTLVPADWRMAFRTELSRMQREQTPRHWSTCIYSGDGQVLTLSITTSATYVEAEQSLRLHWMLRPLNQGSSLHSTFQSPTPSPASLSSPSQQRNASDRTDPQPPIIYEKGETVPLSPQTIWIVRQGLVKLTTMTDSSEEVLLGLAGPGMSLGIGPGSLPTYEAMPLSRVELIQYSMTEVAASTDLCQTLLTHCHQRLQQAEELLAIAGRRRVKDRLYHFLRLLKQQVGSPIPGGGVRLGVRLTHEDLANACCTTRVTVTRLLGQLQQQKKLALDSKSHLILLAELL